MNIVLYLVFVSTILLQATFLPFWFGLTWSLLLVFILVDFSLVEIVILSFLAGFLADIFSGNFFGLQTIIWISLAYSFFMLARKKLSIERNLASSLAFILFGHFCFLLVQILSTSWFSLNNLSFFISSVLSFSFFANLVSNVVMAMIIFFISNFFRVKNKIDAQRL